MVTHAMRLAAASVLIAAAAQAPAHAADVSFAGKSIHLVVNFTAGGPSDIFARHYQPHFERHIPGKPTIVVENRVGASGIIGANYIYNIAKPDGLTIGSLTAVAFHNIVPRPNAKFDVTKFRWLGAVPQTQVILVTADLGVKAPRDLLKPAKPLVYGNTGINANYLNTRLFLDMIGASYKLVSGYRGQSQIIQALRQGEVNITDLGISGYQPNRDSYAREGLFGPVLQRGVLGSDGAFHRHPSLPELPTMAEAIAAINPAAAKTPQYGAMRALVGTYGIQFAFVLPPATPKAIVDTLAKGFAATFRDPEVARSTKARFKVDYEFVDGPSSQAYVERLFADFSADPQVAAVIQGMSKRK